MRAGGARFVLSSVRQGFSGSVQSVEGETLQASDCCAGLVQISGAV